MNRNRLPRLCASVTADLARDLGKPWPPDHSDIGPDKHQRGQIRSAVWCRTGEIIYFPMNAADEQIGTGIFRI